MALPEDQAVERMLAAGFEPAGPYPGFNRPWPSTCIRAGHEVAPSLASITRGRGCRACAGSLPLTLDQVDESLLARGLRRTGPYVNAETPVACRCLTCALNGPPGSATSAPVMLRETPLPPATTTRPPRADRRAAVSRRLRPVGRTAGSERSDADVVEEPDRGFALQHLDQLAQGSGLSPPR